MKKERSALPKEQLKSFVNFISGLKSDRKYFNIFLVLMFTGMRVSEMCALTWEDVDFDNNVIHINKSIAYTNVVENKTMRLIQTPKSASGVSMIPMFTGLYNILWVQKMSQKDILNVTYG